MSDDEIQIRVIPPAELPPITAEEEAMWLTERGRITTITAGEFRARFPEPSDRK